MPSSSSWLDGWRRVLSAPLIVAAVCLLTFLAALPLALVLRAQIAAHLGPSLMADAAADGVNWDWWQEFTSQATGVGTTFTPSVIGFAATLDHLSSLLDGDREILPVAAAVATYLLVWVFLSGGIVDRYARRRRTRAYGFFAACGVFFWRFLRLGVVAGAAYWFLFAFVHEKLFGEWYVDLTGDLDAERTAFLWRFAFYAAFGLLLVAVNVVVDFAKVRLVVEDRRSALGALNASLAFIVRNAAAVIGLYALNAIVFVVLIGVWALVAPGAGRAGGLMWLGVIGTQLYILARLVLKLQFMASETALFQRLLAHAAYTAAPAPVWPDSPAAETISARPASPSAPSAAS
jgi:hypothetical protein